MRNLLVAGIVFMAMCGVCANAQAAFNVASPNVLDGVVTAWGNNDSGQCTVPSTNADFVAVTAGGWHSLGLKSDGSVAAWGFNGQGQCTLPSPNSGFVAVSAGYLHSLGLKSDGSVVAWGQNEYYQCAVPSPNSGFVAVAAGYAYSLGLKSDGSIVAWGNNDNGTCSVPSPNTGFVAVAAGYGHCLGLKFDGSVVGWGDNSLGQCTVPSPNSGFVAVSAGWYHSLGLKSDGSVVPWGSNVNGQCTIPSPNTGFVAVSGGYQNSLCLKSNGSVVAWGDNSYGQCTLPSPNSGFVAVTSGQRHCLALSRVLAAPVIYQHPASQTAFPDAAALFVVQAVGAGTLSYQWRKDTVAISGATKSTYTIASAQFSDAGSYDCVVSNGSKGSTTSNAATLTVLRQNGSVVAWGNNEDGQCSVPSLNADFVGISGGVWHSLGLKADGSVVAWGNNDSGQCTAPSPNSDFVAVAAGGSHSLGLKSDGSVVAWGDNGNFQCNVQSPNAGFVAVAAGMWYSLGLKSDGAVAVWGDNTYGQCSVPSPNSGFVAVGAGGYHSIGLKSDGTVVAWGSNDDGQCNVPSPNADFVAVDAGGYHSLGLKSDGSVVAWGDNGEGQCTLPSPNAGFVAVSAGDYHSLGLKSDGSAMAWGYNYFGQSTNPSPNAGFVAVSAGGYHSLVLSRASAAPVIVQQPASQSVLEGGPVLFVVQAVGSVPLSYQWRQNDENISGATRSTYLIAASQPANKGNYDCVVSNGSKGSTTSNAATLTVRLNGSVLAWGYNEYGQCNVPSPNSDFVIVSGGAWHNLGLKSDGSVVGWGLNNQDQCTVPSPNSDFVGVSAGHAHSLGLKSDGSVVPWGFGGNGECTVPSPNTGFVAVSAGGYFSLGLKSDGSVVTWGSNVHGQCTIPSPNADFVAISAGDTHSLLLKSDGSVVAIGKNTNGECTIPSPNSGFVAVAAGYTHSVGLKSDGSVVAWGSNTDGQCTVPTPNTGFVAIAAGGFHTFGLKSDGSMRVWGQNYDGQSDVPDPNSGFAAVAGGCWHSLALIRSLTAPVIVQHPFARHPLQGGAALFVVRAVGTVPLSYQWRKGGVAIANATRSTYKIASVQTGDIGNYDCVVTNGAGSTTSNAAVLALHGPPSAPTLIAPVNGAQSVSLTPVLQISAFSDPDGYTAALVEFQVASDSAFATITVASGGITPTQSWAVPASNLAQYKRYWWRARYKDNIGTWGYWATAFSFDTGNRPPNAPTLTSPVNSAQNVSLTPSLQIGAFSDLDGDSAALVEYQVASDSAFATVVVTSGGIAPTQTWSVPATKLAQYKRYWWRARYKDNRGTWGYWPTAFSFDTGNRPPNAPTLTSPVNGAQTVSLTPSLQIGAFSDPDGDSAALVEYQVASDSAFATVVVASGGITATQSWTVPATKLSQYNRYWWRARYKDNRGTWGYWPTAFSFGTGNRPPNAPTLTSPVNGAQNVSLTPVLQIGTFSDPDVGNTAALVEYQVASDSGFATVVVTSGGIAPTQSWTVPATKLAQYTRYWWRARHKDSQGTWGYWPTPFSFGTGNRPPNAPTLVSPVNGAQNVSLTPSLQIGAFSDPDFGNTASLVEYQVASDSAFATVVVASGGIAPTQSWTVPATKLAQYKRYWWRARYKDSQGTWGYWPTAFSFDTGNRPPNAPTLSSPANGALNVGLTPALQTLAYSDPDGDAQASGEWQVATDSAFANIVRDSGGTNTTQTSWTVPAAILQMNTLYYWHVRYKDNRGTWGLWSSARSFNTGTSKAKEAIAIGEEVLPLSIEASAGNAIGPMSRLAIRLTATRTVDAATVRVYLDGPNGWTAQSSQWWPVDTLEGMDGWAVYVPETPMPAGMIQVTARAYTILGEPLESVLQTFEVDATLEAGSTGEVALLALDDVSTLPETAGAPLSSAYRIEPTGAFATPVTLQVPLDKACAPEDVEIYYFSESALHQGWYPAADVTGWIVSETAQMVNDKGQIYIELQVNHSGILQLVMTKK